MNVQTRYEIRFGLVALALSGLLFTLGTGLRGPIDFADPGAFILQAAISPNFVPAFTLILLGALLQFYGFFGLYRYLTYRAENLIAFLAFVLSIVEIAFFLPLVTFLAVQAPVIVELYQQGHHEVIAVVEANFTSALGLALLSIGVVAGFVGMILFGVVIWRDGRLPRWTAVVFTLSFFLLAIAVTFITELLGAVLLLISSSTIAWKAWQQTGAS